MNPDRLNLAFVGCSVHPKPEIQISGFGVVGL